LRPPAKRARPPTEVAAGALRSTVSVVEDHSLVEVSYMSTVLEVVCEEGLNPPAKKASPSPVWLFVTTEVAASWHRALEREAVLHVLDVGE